MRRPRSDDRGDGNASDRSIFGDGVPVRGDVRDGQLGPAAWYAHALDLTSGDERSGFPVLINGPAANEPAQVFDPTYQMQRPGLLLMDGVVYAGFGGHCDRGSYAGWIVGVSVEGRLSTMWTTEAGASRSAGAAIWQAGGGLVSDGPGQILFATGNDGLVSVTPTPGDHPSRGTRRGRRARRGPGRRVSGGRGFLLAPGRGLPEPEGPRSRLGSTGGASRDAIRHSRPPAPVGADREVWRRVPPRPRPPRWIRAGPGGERRRYPALGPDGSVWSKPSVWPGDGGYVYVPVAFNCTATDPAGCLHAYRYGTTADGAPSLSLEASTSDPFAYGASAAIITSDGTRSGSAVLWVIWSSGWDGTGSQLRAYDALPTQGAMNLRFVTTIGQGAKFAMPGVGDNRIYVGTRDGHVLGFGLGSIPPLRAEGLAFDAVTLGAIGRSTIRLTAGGSVRVLEAETTGDFRLDESVVDPSRMLVAGDVLSIPAQFAPLAEGRSDGVLVVRTDRGLATMPLVGVGLPVEPVLAAVPSSWSFGQAVAGTTATHAIEIANVGASALTIVDVIQPDPPFFVSRVPEVGDVLLPGISMTVTVECLPSSAVSFAGAFAIVTDGASAIVPLEGSVLTRGQLRITPETIDLGTVPVGQLIATSFLLKNVGETPVTIEQSEPPTSPAFVAASQLDAGTILVLGTALVEVVRASPTRSGSIEDAWQIAADDGQGSHIVRFAIAGLGEPAAADAGAGGAGGSDASPVDAIGDGGDVSGAPNDASNSDQGGPADFGGIEPGGCGCRLAVPETSSSLTALLVSWFFVLVIGRCRKRRALFASVVAGEARAVAGHVDVAGGGVVVAARRRRHCELTGPDTVIDDIAAVAIVRAAAGDEMSLVVHPVQRLAMGTVAVEEDGDLLLVLWEDGP